MDWKKPPPSPDRNQKKHIVPYKQKSIVLRRKEESVEDLQKIQNEMSAIIAQTMDNQKVMRDEAYALQIAANVQPTNIEVIRPKRPKMLAQLSRKMKPEPENWKRNLSKTFEHECLPNMRIELDKKQAAFSNSYHGYWGDDYSPPKSEKLPYVDQSAQNSQMMLEAPNAGKLEQAFSAHGDQTPLYLMDGTSTQVDHNDNEEIIHHRSSSSSDDCVFMHRPESDTDLDRERSPSPSQRHYAVDQRQRSLRSKSVKNSGSKSGRIRDGSDEDLSKSKLKAPDQNASRTEDQRRKYSRRATFHDSSPTSSDQFQRQMKHYEGSKRIDHLKLKETADQDHLSQGLYDQDNTTISDQTNIGVDEDIIDLDELEEEAAVRVAMKHSLEEAEKIKREDEEQLRIAMEHSVMDEIQKRKSKKKKG
ncbi:hypothetical protein niasHT_039203 [Heterodera trifolii]|uniref:Uncharacterized protein n=1 Tax=Heterodera trifolii TaxID=157864 RepID=A0ABD2I904_9BILA